MVDVSSIKGGEKKSAVQAVKFKLTKDQQAYVAGMCGLENRIKVCRDYIAMWMKFFTPFADDLSKREVTAEEEKEFFQVSTQLARMHFTFVELMADTFDRGGDIIKVLTLAGTLSNVQLLPENTRSKLELDWHSLFLDMNKALGRLLRKLPGNRTISQILEAIARGEPLIEVNKK